VTASTTSFRRLREFTPLSKELAPIDIAINAQHYGLPGRLLDWTLNPLIALFFATSTKLSQECAIYVLDAARLDHVNPTFNYESIFLCLDSDYTKGFYGGPYSAPKDGDYFNYMNWFESNQATPVCAFVPLAANRRVSLQAGIFTMQINPFKDLLSEMTTYKLIIPAKAKKTLIRQLRMLNVNEYTVFGDPDHLTGWLRRECDSALLK